MQRKLFDVLLLSITTLLYVAGPACAQKSEEDLTIEKMCLQGLGKSAERYVLSRRKLIGDVPEVRIKWSIRLMECRAQIALRSAEASAWGQCQKSYEEILLVDSKNPRLPWATWQLARCHLLQAQANLAQYLAAPGRSQPRETALQLVREILRETEELEDDIKRRQPLAARQGASGGAEAPADQLAQLAVDSGLLRCESLLVRAKLYAAESKDRIAAATDVESEARTILETTSKDWASRTPLVIAQATAQLELGKRTEGLRALAQVLAEASSPQPRYRAAVIAIDYLATNNEVSRAQALLPYLAGAGAHYKLALLQLKLAELERVSESDRAQMLDGLVAQAQQIGKDYGDYWRNRAEALLLGSNASAGDASTASIDLMLIEIRQLLAAEKNAEAIAKLIEFRDNESSQGKGANALQLARLASTLLQRDSEWLRAAEAVSDVAVKHAEEPEAAKAHVGAILALSQALRAAPTNSGLAERYEDALKQQLVIWPDASESVQPQGWLESWLRSKKRTAEYFQVLLERAAASDDATVVFKTLETWLNAVARQDDPKLASVAIGELNQSISAGSFSGKLATAKLFELAAMAVSDWPALESLRKLDSELNSLFGQLTSSSDKALAAAILALNDIRLKSLASAEIHLRQWDATQVSDATRRLIATQYVEAISEASFGRHRQWVRATLKGPSMIADLTDSADLNEQLAGYRLDLWSGNVTPALQELNKLSKENTRNGWVQLQLASALADTGANRISDSDRIARRIAASSKPGTELYLAARWRLIRNSQQAGDMDKAKQSARLILAAQPVEIAIYRERFESVAAQ